MSHQQIDMHDLADSNGYDNLGFNDERNRDADATSHQTTLTNISNNETPNATPRSMNGNTKKTLKKNSKISERSISAEVLDKRHSISKATKETAMITGKKPANRTHQNKETMKYAKKQEIDKKAKNYDATKNLRNTEKVARTTKQKMDDKKGIKRNTNLPKDQIEEKHGKEGSKRNSNHEEGSGHKKKVKIKESLSQKIKKTNTSLGEKVDKKPLSKSSSKSLENIEGHERSVKYLIDQAMEANDEENAKSATVLTQKEKVPQIKSIRKDISVDEEDVAETIEKSTTDPLMDVNCDAEIQEKDNTNKRKLERVETDDCTSIDTSTLPPPPDEILLNTGDVLSDSNFEERFIA